ncbi:bifunctional enoyl-CoA hydratase/phosphate acetyltransferase [Aciduricibacillus chroicocephali]|uniref:Bifunctional enoyl-CoA hydratase/phosphate acetyltransferase n=1 Tax=Aciduricibacillus chroicocephali TaxID=3054939 RepID=A0ABY9KUS8_9BACI|nr:bifunctional enoyl-CoA hydratase/phosphate acetyltransferase [Bacillaceae bacterium 44XB]
MNHLNELLETAKTELRPVIAVAGVKGSELFHAVKVALELKLATFHIFGTLSEISRFHRETGLDSDFASIKAYPVENGSAASAAVRHIKSGHAHILMKGDVSTKEMLQAVLDREHGLRQEKLLSHVAVFDVPGREKPVILTDAAINISPDLTDKVRIAAHAVDIGHTLGIKCPKVAAIAPVDVINEAIPSTLDAAKLAEMQEKGEITGCLVGGPISFDNAISPETARQKGVASKVAGCSDILLVPSIEAGNALYKAFVFFARAKVAAVVCGASVPIVLPSRADCWESKLYSIALAIIIFGKNRDRSDKNAANSCNQSKG